MKKTLFLSFLFLFAVVPFLTAQEKAIDKAFKKSSIETLNKLMNDFYVFPEVAKKTEVHLNKLLKSGYFDEFENTESFAKALTKEVQVINKDKHMRISARTIGAAPVHTVDRLFEEHLYYKSRSRSNMAGFKEAKKLDGNIGYLDLRGFAGVQSGAPVADSYMKLLSTSDAMIIDLRKNGGGDPNMVQYLCSFFFDKKVHLNSLYWREGDRTDEFWTLDKVNGERMPDVPLFVITSPRTFSGAEEFSYNMQTQKRATLVGETTGGGANPGGSRTINDHLNVFIPVGKAINPITGTNWEGVGVVPEVMTTARDAYDKAVELAREAAEEYRKKKSDEYMSILDKLKINLEEVTKKHTDKEVGKYKNGAFKTLKKAVEIGLLDEGDINYIGYNYLNQYEQPVQAELILKSNTVLFPESANVYDSYGEVLAANGKIEEAVKSFEKAIEAGEKNNDPQLGLYKKNLKATKEKIKP
jgi:hypothetical protein